MDPHGGWLGFAAAQHIRVGRLRDWYEPAALAEGESRRSQRRSAAAAPAEVPMPATRAAPAWAARTSAAPSVPQHVALHNMRTISINTERQARYWRARVSALAKARCSKAKQNA